MLAALDVLASFRNFIGLMKSALFDETTVVSGLGIEMFCLFADLGVFRLPGVFFLVEFPRFFW